MIYFTIDFTQGDEVVNPVVNLKRAIIVWVFFHLFTHLDIAPTVIVLLLFMTLFFMSNYMTYLEQINQKNSKLSKTLKKVEEVLFFLVLGIILIVFLFTIIWKKRRIWKKI